MDYSFATLRSRPITAHSLSPPRPPIITHPMLSSRASARILQNSQEPSSPFYLQPLALEDECGKGANHKSRCLMHRIQRPSSVRGGFGAPF